MSAKADKSYLAKKSSASHQVELSDSLRQSTVDEIIDNETIPAYSESQVRSMDVSKPSGVTVSDLKLITKGNLVGLESAFLKAEEDYGINCLFVIAIASLESANGTICFKPNNMFGFGNTGFSSKAEGIDVVSKALAKKYLNPSSSLYSGKTISAVNKRYAASSTWDDKVAARMVSYYSVISKNHNAAINKLK
jgi:beta-N-acetylglucosaminidase